jgi:hypothetical protein
MATKRRASSEKLYKAYLDFSGGQNGDSAPDNVRDTECEFIENFDIITRGGLSSRPGTTVTCTIGADSQYPVNRIIEHSKGDGTVKRLSYLNHAIYDNDAPSVPLLELSATSTSDLDYARFGDNTYILVDNNFYQYDGVAITAVVPNAETDNIYTSAGLKGCKYLEKRGDRMFMTGNPANPSALYVSQTLDPTYFKQGSAVVSTIGDDADMTTGLKEFHGALLVFKPRSIYAWYGYDLATDVQFKKLDVHTGTRAYRTIQNVGDNLFYLGIDGVYALTGTYETVIKSHKISGKVNSEFKKLVNVAPSYYYMNSPCAIYKDGKYMLAYSTDAITKRNNRIAVFHTDAWNPSESDSEPWTFYKNVNASDMLYSYDDSLLLCSSINNTIFKFDESVTSDFGNAIPYKIVFKNYNLDYPIHQKKIKRGWVVLRQFAEESTQFDLKTTVDYKSVEGTVVNHIEGDHSLVYGEGAWGDAYWGWADTITKCFELNGTKGKRVQNSIEGEVLNNKIFVYGLAYEYKLKKPERGE